MPKSEQPIGIRTLAVHAGEEPDAATGASAPNIVMSTTFVAAPDASFSVEGMDEETPFIYTRWGNPTVSQLERKLAALEGAVSTHSGHDPFEHCVYIKDKVVPAMAKLREVADDLETRIAEDIWPLPTYREMLSIK